MKQKRLLFLLALLMTAATGAWAQEPIVVASGTCGDPNVNGGAGVTWSLTSDGVITISKASGSSSGAMADYYALNSKAPWNSHKASITSVVVEEGVTHIGNQSFYGYTNVASISLPEGLLTIGSEAFTTQPSNLASITIPASVTSIGNKAFEGLSSLTSVTFAEGSSLTSIGERAFAGCSNAGFTSITLPASVTSLGEKAFFECNKLATVTLNSNPHIATGAFRNIDPDAVVTMNLTAISAGSAKWRTFFNDTYNFQADANTQVFKAELSGTGITLHEVEDKIVDKGTAVVLKTTGDHIVMTRTSTMSSDAQSDELVGVLPAAGVPSDGTYMVLQNGASGMGFYKLASGQNIPVGTAFLIDDSENDFYSVLSEPTVTVTHSNQSVTEYSSLAAAFAQTGVVNTNLQDGDVVTLLADQEGLTGKLTLYGKQITVDLNGHTVSSSEAVFDLNNGADLTLTSSEAGGAINATFASTDDNEFAIFVRKDSKLTIPESSLPITISTNAIAIFDVGEVVIAGSPTISGTQCGLYSMEAEWPVKATISGSPTITSDGYGILFGSLTAQLTISGAPTISGKASGIIALCPLTISGQPKVTSQGVTEGMTFPLPYDIVSILFPLNIGGTAEHPASLDFTGSTATGNLAIMSPISISGPVALGGDDKWTVTLFDINTFTTTGTITSGWATNMSGAALTDYFAGGQLSNGTNLIVMTDDNGEGALVATYAVNLNDGAENPTTWTGKVGTGDFGNLPLQDVSEGQTVTLKYNGRLKVKDVAAKIVMIDLSKLAADYTAKNGDVLTGTLDGKTQPYKITIANGATVTLAGVTINGVNDGNCKWAGLTCEGSATIILKDVSTNTVKGFYNEYPGIFVPSGSTLIIKGEAAGTGALTASPFDGGGNQSYGAGIGGRYKSDCGNIEIQGGNITATGGIYAAGIGAGKEVACYGITISGGNVRATGGKFAAGIGAGQEGACGTITISGGTITATGGTWAAGIGSGYLGSDCGDITISGGTITAMGGKLAAGIGSGYKSDTSGASTSSCGTISITTGVTKVTATKGEDAYNSIGAGNKSTCGTVTIGCTLDDGGNPVGGTEYWDGSGYQYGGDTYLRQATITYEPSN